MDSKFGCFVKGIIKFYSVAYVNLLVSLIIFFVLMISNSASVLANTPNNELTASDHKFIKSYDLTYGENAFFDEFIDRLKPEFCFSAEPTCIEESVRKIHFDVRLHYFSEVPEQQTLIFKNIAYFFDTAGELGLITEISTEKWNGRVEFADRSNLIFMVLNEDSRKHIFSAENANIDGKIAPLKKEVFEEIREGVFPCAAMVLENGLSPNLNWLIFVNGDLSESDLAFCIKEELIGITGLMNDPNDEASLMKSDYVLENAPRLDPPLYWGYAERDILFMKIFASKKFYDGMSILEAKDVARAIIY